MQRFTPNADGHRPCRDNDHRYAHDPAWDKRVLFYEYFHGDTGRGLGTSHQTERTVLVSSLLRPHTADG